MTKSQSLARADTFFRYDWWETCHVPGVAGLDHRADGHRRPAPSGPPRRRGSWPSTTGSEPGSRRPTTGRARSTGRLRRGHVPGRRDRGLRPDVQIPRKYGLDQTVGRHARAGRGVPASCARRRPTARSPTTAPALSERADRNYANPMAMSCWYLSELGIRTVGLCHSVQGPAACWRAKLACRTRTSVPLCRHQSPGVVHSLSGGGRHRSLPAAARGDGPLHLPTRQERTADGRPRRA